MKVLEVRKITLADNLNHGPSVVPLPSATFEGTLSYEQREDWLLAFSDPDAFNDVHDGEDLK